jgi:hypothetical protein
LNGRAELAGTFSLESVVFPTSGPIVATSTALIIDNSNLDVKGQNGSLTVQGKLQVSQGIFNVGVDDDDCLILAPLSTFIGDGTGEVNVTAAMGVTSPTNRVSFLLDGGTIRVQTVGNNSTTFAGFDLGFSSLTAATSTAGTIVIQNPNSAVTGPGDFRMPLGTTITGGTLDLTSVSDSRMSGAIPNLALGPHTVKLEGTTTFVLPTTIPSGAELNLNGKTLTVRNDLDITSGAFLNATSTSSTIWFGGTSQQNFNMDGTSIDGHIRAMTIFNSSGASPGVNLNDYINVSGSVSLTNGSLGGPGILVIGNYLAAATTTVTVVNGSLDNQPIFNAGTLNVTYNNSISPRTTGY